MVSCMHVRLFCFHIISITFHEEHKHFKSALNINCWQQIDINFLIKKKIVTLLTLDSKLNTELVYVVCYLTTMAIPRSTTVLLISLSRKFWISLFFQVDNNSYSYTTYQYYTWVSLFASRCISYFQIHVYSC